MKRINEQEREKGTGKAKEKEMNKKGMKKKGQIEQEK